MELATVQTRRFSRALADLPEDARAGAIEFLLAMIEPAERDKVAALVWCETPARVRAAP